MTVVGVAASNPVALEPFRAQIEAALVYADATHTYDDVASMVAAGRAQFWPGPASMIVTEIIDHPRKRLLNFFLAAGRRAELQAMTPLILEWGTTQGCQTATLVGRRGWSRTFLAQTGWTVSPLILMEHDLGNLEHRL